MTKSRFCEKVDLYDSNCTSTMYPSKTLPVRLIYMSGSHVNSFMGPPFKTTENFAFCRNRVLGKFFFEIKISQKRLVEGDLTFYCIINITTELLVTYTGHFIDRQALNAQIFCNISKTPRNLFIELSSFACFKASYVSVLTVVAFSTERYIAICYPLYLRAISGLQRAIWIIAGLWIVSLLCALPFAVHTTISYVFYPYNSTDIVKESAMCSMVTQPENFPLTELSSIIFFILPMVIIAVLYTNMGITIARASKNKFESKVKGSIHRKNKKNQSNKNIIRMLSLVVLGFFVCWAPFHAQRLMTIYFRDNELIEEVNYWMFFITGLCYYFSSTLNPILYNIMSEKMRNAFKEIFCGIKPKKNSKRGTFRETSNTYVSMHNNHNHHNCLELDEDLFLSKDLLNREDSLMDNGKKYIHHHQTSRLKSKIFNETGV
ncbi:hypothetical protein ABEB36_004043 [Hypothenemus hampei]|uniref:G-protein coupled receptors family 1 profile domain-containing protein n=1 Tax=Hypothenemus hampei TaxID=57062 RepID=A0ABD1F219_HYPHA